MRYLVDTHVLVRWLLRGVASLSKEHSRVVRRFSPEAPGLVSEISHWEVALLVERGRLRLRSPLREWLEQATKPPLLERVGITPAIAAATAELPPGFHRDPGDRILVATARTLGATLLTEDEAIIASKACLTL